jgi:uncharacterized cupin superfamily protein
MSLPPIKAMDVALNTRKTIYPEPFASRVAGRFKRRLGDHFGLKNFGVNLTQLEPGACSALAHHHSAQDEFIYVLDGSPVALLGPQEYQLEAGDCFGFPAGTGLAHQLVNRSKERVSYLEMGDRSTGDACEYPQDDLAFGISADGSIIMVHKDGRPY